MSLWNNPAVQNVGGRAKGTLNDFEKFILRGNVVDLAVGIVIGAAFTGVVNAFVADLITPLIGIFGKIDLSAYAFTINNSKFQIGAFLNAVISFVIMALVIFFFVVKPVNALMAMHKSKPPEAPSTRDCPYCLSSISIQATRCAYCTSPLPPAGPPPTSAQPAS
ncbi:MAG TPA: large conductance mechanosensitive channel protein MscL [Ktedonobacteraceae bacterium]|nr:large conductance mechanosensitive channel protein MscL [Ktedonobacteraceae bacterium]